MTPKYLKLLVTYDMADIDKDPDVKTMMTTMMSNQLSHEKTEIESRLEHGWAQLSAAVQSQCRADPGKLAYSLQLEGFKKPSDLPRSRDKRMEFFRRLNPDEGMLHLLRTSLGLEPPTLNIDLLTGKAYDITRDRTTTFRVLQLGNQEYSSVGCLLPANVEATLESQTTRHFFIARSNEDFVKKRLHDLGVSVDFAKAPVGFNYAHKSGYNVSTQQGFSKISFVYEQRLLKVEPYSATGTDALLSRELKQALVTLPTTYNKADKGNVNQWKSFFRSCGTHYVASASVGGLVVFEVTSKNASFNQSQFDSHQVGAEGFIKSIFASLSYRAEGSSSSSYSEFRKEVDISVYGGSPEASGALSRSQSDEEVMQNLERWVGTLWENPIVTDYSVKLRNITEVVRQVRPEVLAAMELAMQDLYAAALTYEPPPKPVENKESNTRAGLSEANKDPGGSGCLTAETPISTPSGGVPIASLEPGDLVLDRSGKPVKVIAVVKTFPTDGGTLLYGFQDDYGIASRPFFTPAHPFLAPSGEILVANKRLLLMGHPQLGETGRKVKQMPASGIHLMTLKNNGEPEPVVVVGLTSSQVEEALPLYFLVVEGDGSYVAHGYVTFVELPDFSASWVKVFQIIMSTASCLAGCSRLDRVDFERSAFKTVLKLAEEIKYEWECLINNSGGGPTMPEVCAAFGELNNEEHFTKILARIMTNDHSANLALILYSRYGTMLFRHVEQLGMDAALFISAAMARVRMFYNGTA